MAMLLNPVSATLAGWQLWGKSIETQLRVSKVVGQAMLSPLSAFSPVTPAPAPKAKPRKPRKAKTPVFTPATRQAIAKPKAVKVVSAPVKAEPSAKAKAQAPAPKPVVAKAAPVKPAPAAPVVKKTTPPAPVAAKAAAVKAPMQKVAPVAVDPAKKKKRAPSKPPTLPVRPKG